MNDPEVMRLRSLIRRVLEWQPAFPVESSLLDELANAIRDSPADAHHCETCVCPETAKLPDSMRDPLACMERGRELESLASGELEPFRVGKCDFPGCELPKYIRHHTHAKGAQRTGAES